MSTSAPVNYVRIPFAGGSDGDGTKVPGAGGGIVTAAFADAQPYLTKLATWQMEHQSIPTVTPGVTYILDPLPTGFTLWTRTRTRATSGTLQVDKFVWGHSSGHGYRSTKEFKPHFDWLLSNQEGICACNLCTTYGQHPARSTTSITTNAQLAQAQNPLQPQTTSLNSGIMASSNTAMAMTLDTDVRTVTAGGVIRKGPVQFTGEDIANHSYTSLVQRLMVEGELDVAFEEPKCLDWIVERQCMAEYEPILQENLQFNYRAGEVVLFEPSLEPFETVQLEPSSDRFAILNTQTGLWRRASWMAGVVTQLPVFALVFVDGIEMCEYDDTTNPNTCYRIEDFPCPTQLPTNFVNRDFKITPSAIRPFSCFGEIIYPRDHNSCHPSIKYALQIASVFSLVDKYQFVGKGNNVDLYCRGIYIGAELVVRGDFIRVFDIPNPNVDPVIFQVTGIALQHRNIGGPDESRCVVLIGRYPQPSEVGYTTEPPPYDPNLLWGIPFSRFVGRLLEKEAAKIILRPMVSPDHRDSGKLEINDRAVRQARVTSTRALRESGKITAQQKWHWADYRIRALCMSNVNGQEPAYFNPELDYMLWEASGQRGGGVQANFG